VGLAIAGGVTTGALWLVSLGIGLALEDDARKEEERRNQANETGAYYYPESSGLLGLVGADDVVWPLALPVVGPFVTMGTANARGAGLAALLLDGVIQTGGLAMLIVGLAVKKPVLVLQQATEARLRISPSLGPTGAGFGLRAEM
jgi:hypothetical protein